MEGLRALYHFTIPFIPSSAFIICSPCTWHPKQSSCPVQVGLNLQHCSYLGSSPELSKDHRARAPTALSHQLSVPAALGLNSTTRCRMWVWGTALIPELTVGLGSAPWHSERLAVMSEDSEHSGGSNVGIHLLALVK